MPSELPPVSPSEHSLPRSTPSHAPPPTPTTVERRRAARARLSSALSTSKPWRPPGAAQRDEKGREKGTEKPVSAGEAAVPPAAEPEVAPPVEKVDEAPTTATVLPDSKSRKTNQLGRLTMITAASGWDIKLRELVMKEAKLSPEPVPRKIHARRSMSALSLQISPTPRPISTLFSPVEEEPSSSPSSFVPPSPCASPESTDEPPETPLSSFPSSIPRPIRNPHARASEFGAIVQGYDERLREIVMEAAQPSIDGSARRMRRSQSCVAGMSSIYMRDEFRDSKESALNELSKCESATPPPADIPPTRHGNHATIRVPRRMTSIPVTLDTPPVQSPTSPGFLSPTRLRTRSMALPSRGYPRPWAVNMVAEGQEPDMGAAPVSTGLAPPSHRRTASYSPRRQVGTVLEVDEPHAVPASTLAPPLHRRTGSYSPRRHGMLPAAREHPVPRTPTPTPPSRSPTPPHSDPSDPRHARRVQFEGEGDPGPPGSPAPVVVRLKRFSEISYEVDKDSAVDVGGRGSCDGGDSAGRAGKAPGAM
ncbi:hypothetical protein BDK51DRAFT_47060 [Blyttiomyces helicus]|uniref:Uncharacterized protein n=1 Tax=Blyttiomyces helicus TaxID=388810 RepID=A0A4P9W3E6_9FUNG|nr:hypothetical protein BDK51DRAFT_47060 [Blyttiomyces helicus]|eukprot:RKO86332.1 hypothetical protein BDK51DRAFT_47060 [Blyttiomyces helicus]